jgi:hypothetical protein
MKLQTRNVLVIGDLHAPFSHPDYLTFCKQVAKRYKTKHTVFIGDEVDNHAASRFPSDPDGHGAGEELKRAREELAKWHKAFPHADVIIGNHTAIPRRQLKANGVPEDWCRSFAEVLEVPTWNYLISKEIDDVLYIHGEGKTARAEALQRGKNVVQGHRHTESYVWHNSGNNTFGMQVGTGIDNQAYAFAYARHHQPPALSCGVVLNNGREAVVIPMV